MKHLIEFDKTYSRPANAASYRAEQKVREFKKQETDWMLTMDGIDPAQAEWASQIAFIPKKDGKFRLCH